MGSCVPRKQAVTLPTQGLRKAQLEKNADDSEQYLFTIRFSDFKVFGLPLDLPYISLAFREERIDSELGLEDTVDKAIYWDFAWEFTYRSTIQKLVSETAAVCLYSNHKKFATLRLNMYEVARGPNQYSISLPRKKGRLSLQIDFFQQTNVGVRGSKVKCMLPYPVGSEFSFTLKLMSHHNLLGKHSVVKSDPKWEFDRHDSSADVPKLVFPANIADVRNAILNVKLWLLSEGSWKEAGQCWVTFPKLLKTHHFQPFQDELKICKTDSMGTVNNPGEFLVGFQEDLVKKGRKLGTIKGRLWISNLPFIHQLITGVSTDDKIEVQDLPVIDNKQPVHKKLALTNETSDLLALTTKLKATVKKYSRFSHMAATATCAEFFDTLQQISNILQRSSKRQAMSFTYNNVTELLSAQTVMLKLAEHLCKYCDQLFYSVRPHYCECLGHLLRRGELDLGSLGLNVRDKKLLAAKTQVAMRYRQLLSCLLQFSLPKLNLKGAEMRVYNFVEFFLTMAYFRVPGFRDKVLVCIQKKMWEELEEFSSIELKEETQNITAEYAPMLNWSDMFYSYLPQTREQRHFLKLLHDQKWQVVLAKRSSAYFKFVEEWALHVDRQFVNQHIPWKEIPGYTLIVKSFLLELKNRNILKYPESLILASCKLLLNADLFKPFTEILFSKANIYRYKTVTEALSILSVWFDTLWTKHRKLPFIFDERYCIKALKIVLSDEVAITVAKGLWLLYRHYHLFQGHMREVLIRDLLIGELFNKFMFSWSRQVRIVFMHVLLYRISSLLEFSFEEGLPTALDVHIATAVEQRLAGLSYDQATPYLKLALEEFKRVSEQYRPWLFKVMAKSVEKPSVYGPFESFPYPDIHLEPVRDKTEWHSDDDFF